MSKLTVGNGGMFESCSVVNEPSIISLLSGVGSTSDVEVSPHIERNSKKIINFFIRNTYCCKLTISLQR